MYRGKLVSILLCISMFAITLTSCGTKNEQVMSAVSEKPVVSNTKASKEPKKKQYEIALVTDLGTINDRSFNQAAWEGIQKYANEKEVSYTYYQPEEGTVDSYEATIKEAIQGGAKVVICPGYLFEVPVFNLQDKYADVTFIMIDGKPHNAAYSELRINKNVLPVLFHEEEAGFLAGYAAVKDGYRKLGFMGGMAVPAVIHYGYGFVQGCDYASKELGIRININYTYTGTFCASPDIEALAVSWYQKNTELIFACGGAIGNSVIAAAEKEKDAKVIGVDMDQSSLSKTVITSAMKMVPRVVYNAITEYYSNSFKGGAVVWYSAKNDGVGLPLDTSKFKTFSKADYKKIYDKLVARKIVINNNIEDSTTADIKLKAAKVNYIQ